MSKTNCINCGAAKEVSDLICPFCGTKYADMTAFDLMSDDPIYIQLSGENGHVKACKAYITNRELRFYPEYACLYADDHMLQRKRVSTNVNGKIEFVLYEGL